MFAVEGMAPDEVLEDLPVVDIPEESEQPSELPSVVDIPVVEQPEETEQLADDLPELPDQSEQTGIHSEETPIEPEVPIEQPEEVVPPVDDSLLEEIPSIEDESSAEIPVDEISPASEGTFVLVTTDTRAFLEVDDSVSDDYEGDLNLGVFVQDAARSAPICRVGQHGPLLVPRPLHVRRYLCRRHAEMDGLQFDLCAGQ